MRVLLVEDDEMIGHSLHKALEANGWSVDWVKEGELAQRFSRVPGNGSKGSGLGLSIAQNAAQRCGLGVVLRNREDRSGLVARIELLPVAAAPAGSDRTVVPAVTGNRDPLIAG